MVTQASKGGRDMPGLHRFVAVSPVRNLTCGRELRRWAMRPRVAIATGDPTGIGPEIAAKAAAVAMMFHAVEAVVLAAQLATPREGDAID